jgi:hypothetical protein
LRLPDGRDGGVLILEINVAVVVKIQRLCGKTPRSRLL